MPNDRDRYARQTALPMIGIDGQRRLRESHALVVGCGALGTVIVDQLARAGVGTITIVDRDVVAWSNLQRQSLFDEEDARRSTPKAEAAKARVAKINGEVRVRAFWDDLGPRNAMRYAEGVDVIIDGLDTLESRYLLNDLSVATGTPYVYGAAVGTEGMLAVVRPGVTPCLRCIFPELPPPGTIATCESAGVLGSVTALVASLEATQAIKLIVGATDACDTGFVMIDVWTNSWRRLETSGQRDPDCPCCGRRQFDFLSGARIANLMVLCGTNAVQIAPSGTVPCDLDAVADRLAPHGPVERGDGVVRASIAADGVDLTIFVDGRVVVRGTTELDRARSLVARYIGT